MRSKSADRAIFDKRFQIHHIEIAALFKIPVTIQHIGNATAHTCGKIAASVAQYHDRATGHVFATMIAYALDHRCCTGISYRKTLPGNTTKITLTTDRAVQYGVPDNNILLRNDRAVRWRQDHNPPSGQAFAYIVIRIPMQYDADTMRQKGSEALAGSARNTDTNRILRQARMPVTPGNFARQHGRKSTVDVFHLYANS